MSRSRALAFLVLVSAHGFVGCHSAESGSQRSTWTGPRASVTPLVIPPSSARGTPSEAAPAVSVSVPREAGRERPCERVAHIGDSLTYYTVPSLHAAYQRVGLRAQISAFGGRAILQKLPDDSATGQEAALSFRAQEFDGCYVVALGTNDTANVSSGSAYSRAEAIDEMMKAIDPSARARVMWVNAYTTRRTGDYSNGNMVLWNSELENAKLRWPNLRVFDWASVAGTGKAPLADGIHYTAEGYEVRNTAIAEALSGFFGTLSPVH